MKYLLIAIVLALSSTAVMAKGGSHSSSSSHGTGAKTSRTHVSGYTKKNGKHVNAYNRSTADGTKANNWSTKGNVNPETGKPGSK